MDQRHELERRLGEHARTVRGLAAALLRDPSAADDVVQEAALRAVAMPPRQPAALRGWLQAVVQRLCGRWQRSDRRRLQREAAAARQERLPSAADEVLRAEVLQAIANAVAALPVPLREVVLLRYYDDLPPRAIAARLQLSGEAVESRLRRARAQLATALAPRFDQRDLRTALLAFAVTPAATLPVLGAFVMAAKSKAVLAATALLLLLGGSVFWLWPAPEQPPLPAGGNPAPAGLVAATTATSPSERIAVREPETRASEEKAAAPATWTVRLVGRVVDERRRPVGGAQVTAQESEGSSVTGLSGEDGRFQLVLSSAGLWQCQGELLARRDERSGIAQFTFQREPEQEHDVGVVALEPSSELRVDVRRGSAPVANAKVTVIRAWFAPPGVRVEGTTQEDGSVTLRGLGQRRYFVVATAADGSWGLSTGDVGLRRSNRAVIDLAAGSSIEVQVLAAGTREPIAGAQVEAMYGLPGEGGIESKLPLTGLVPLPVTDAEGRARVQGFLSASHVQIGANHPRFRPELAWNSRRVDWKVSPPRIEVTLEPMASVTWNLVAGEVAVPPDGTVFRILDMPTPLRDGCLTFTARPLVSTSVAAVGPGCVAVLPVPASGPVPLRRPRRLTVYVHDIAGAPLAGWPIGCMSADWSRSVKVSTGSDGRALAEGFAGGKVEVELRGQNRMEPLGKVDLEAGDGFLEVVRAPGRAVRAQVFVGGLPCLPGELNLECTNAWLSDVREDVDRGVLTFTLWPHDPKRDHQVRLYGCWRQSTGVAAIPPGTGPADIELRLEALGAAVADVRPPADDRCQIMVERLWPSGQTSIWTHVQVGRARDLPPFTNLPPGRYRLRDQLSEVVGPEVDVVGDGDEARLPLDLSAVVPVQGRVVADGEMKGTSVRVRDAGGAALRNVPVQADGSFTLRMAVDRSGLVLVAVRGTAVSAPMPVTGPMTDVQLVLPR